MNVTSIQKTCMYSNCPIICLSVCPFVRLFVHSSIHPSIHPSIYLRIYIAPLQGNYSEMLPTRGIARKTSGGCDFGGLTFIFGIFLCIFRLLQQEWIHFSGDLNPGNPLKYAHAPSPGPGKMKYKQNKMPSKFKIIICIILNNMS